MGIGKPTVPDRYVFPGVTEGQGEHPMRMLHNIHHPYYAIPPQAVTILRLDIMVETMRWIGLMVGRKVLKNP